MSDEEGEEKTEENNKVALGELVDLISSKRASGRKQGLERLRLFLQSTVDSEVLESNILTLEAALLGVAKKGGHDEAALAFTCASLVAVGLGLPSDGTVRLYNAFRPLCEQIIRNSSKASRTRAAAVHALGMLSFVALGDASQLRPILNFFFAVCSEVKMTSNSDVRVSIATTGSDIVHAALTNWSLLATILPASSIDGAFLRKHMPVFVTLIRHTDVDVRVAAGTCIALLYAVIDPERGERKITRDVHDDRMQDLGEHAAEEDADLLLHRGPDDSWRTDVMEYEDFDPDADEETGSSQDVDEYNAKYDSYENEYTYDTKSGLPSKEELLEELDHLASDSRKSTAKQDRARQKKAFRMVLRSVEDGIEPEERLKIDKTVFHFQGWDQFMRLSAFRSLLATGFQRHLRENDLVHDVFQISIEGSNSYSEIDERQKTNKMRNLMRQSSAKQQYLTVTRDRKKKSRQRQTLVSDDS